MTLPDTLGRASVSYESPLLIDLGLIHEQTATCDFGHEPSDPRSDSGVVTDPDGGDLDPRFPC